MTDSLNYRVISLVLSAVFLAGMIAFANMARADVEAPEDVNHFLEAYSLALAQCDDEIFSQLIDEQYSGFGVRGALGRGKAFAVASFCRQCANSGPVTIRFEIIDLNVSDGMVTVVTNGYLGAGGNNRPSIGATFILQRSSVDAAYVLRHSHFSARSL